MKLQNVIKSRLQKTGFYLAAICLGLIGIYAIMGGNDNIEGLKWPSFVESAHAQGSVCSLDKTKIETIKNSAQGFFKNIRFAEDPYYGGALAFKNAKGEDITLNDFKGKTLLVNFWAVWCVPCREEMPELAHLHHVLGGDRFEVVTVNIDKNPDEKVLAFLKDVKADNLELYRDTSMKVFNDVRKAGLALGLPVTLLLDDEGCLIGSFNGSAPWGNEDAQALIKSIMKTDGQAE